MPEAAYHRIAGDLRSKIESGVLRPGDKLPTRRQLAAEYRVSDRLPGEAVRQLAREGLVVARPGAGTFVLPPPTPLLVRRGWPSAVPPGTTSVTEQVTARLATAGEAAELAVAPGAAVLAVTRIYWAGNQSCGEDTTLLAAARDVLVYEILPG